MMSDAERWDHSGYNEMIKEENSKFGNTKKGFFGKYDKGGVNNQNDRSGNYEYNDHQNYKRNNNKKFPYNGSKYTTEDWNSDKPRSDINGVGNIKNLKQRKIRKENNYFPENPNSEMGESSHQSRFYNMNEKDENQFEHNLGQINMYKKGGNFQHTIPGSAPHQNNFYQRKKPYQSNHSQLNNPNILQKSPQGNINSNPMMFNHYDPKMMMPPQNNFPQPSYNQMGMHHPPFNPNFNNFPLHYNQYKFKDNNAGSQNLTSIPNTQSNNLNNATNKSGGSKNNSCGNITMSSNLSSNLNSNSHSGITKILETTSNNPDTDGENEGKNSEKPNVLNEKGRDKRQFMNVINTIKSNTLQNFQNKINLSKSKQSENFSSDANISLSVIDEKGNISNSSGHTLNTTMNSNQNITPRMTANHVPQANSLPYPTGTINNYSPQGGQMGNNYYSPMSNQVTDPMMMHNFQQNNNLNNPSKFMNMSRMNMMNMNNNIGNNMNMNMKSMNNNINTNPAQPFYGMIPVPMIDPNQMNNFNPNMYGKFPYMNNQIKNNTTNSDMSKIQHSHSMGYEDMMSIEQRPQQINFHPNNSNLVNSSMQKFNNNRSNQGTPNSSVNLNPINQNNMYIKNNTVNFNNVPNNLNRNFRFNEGQAIMNKNLPKKNMFQRGKFSSEKNLLAHTLGNLASETYLKKQSSNQQKSTQPTHIHAEKKNIESDHTLNQNEATNEQKVSMYVSVKLAEREEVICINPGANLLNVAREFLTNNKLDENLLKPLIKMIEKSLAALGNICEAKLDKSNMMSLIKLGQCYRANCNEENSTSSELDHSYRTDTCSVDFTDGLDSFYPTIEELKEVDRLNFSQ